MNAPMILGAAALTMTSLEIAELTGKQHAHVMRDIRTLMDELATNPELDSCVISTTYSGGDGRQYPQYELDKDTCLTLLLGYDSVARMKVVKRWQELEAGQKPAELSRIDILQLAMESEQARIEAEKQLALVAPKVEYVDRYVAANGAQGFRQVAKLLNANEPEFRLFLQDKKIMYRLGGEWTAHQNHIEAGRFVVKTGVATRNEHAFSTTKFTPKGVEWIAGEWAKHRVAQKVGVLA